MRCWSKLIGLKLFTFSGFSVFGMRVMQVWLMPGGITLGWKTWLIRIIQSSAIVFQKLWKNQEWKPSRPGLLFFPMLNTASLTSNSFRVWLQSKQPFEIEIGGLECSSKEKRFEKYWTKSCSICSCLKNSSPTSFLMNWILLKFMLMIVKRWKYLVFLSPSKTHWNLI